MAEPILKDSIAVGLGRLVDEFEEKPNIVGTLDAFLQETQAVEDLAFEVNTAFDKDTAIGAQLDVIGKLVGEPRNGKDDEPYRDAINGTIDANTATGTIDSVTGVIQRSLPDSVDYYNTVNYMPEPYNPEGWPAAMTDPDGGIVNQDLLNPSGQSFIGLAEISTTGNLTLQFPQNVTDGVTGEVFYTGIVIKNIIGEGSLNFRLQADGGTIDQTGISLTTLEQTSGVGNIRVTTLSDGFSLIEIAQTLTADVNNIDMLLFWFGEVGDQLSSQASFFGRTGKALSDPNQYPATIRLAEEKSVRVFEHFPADIHVVVNSPESQAISDSLEVIRSAGVKGTLAFTPESSIALVPQEILIERRFLVTNLGDQIVTNDGGGGLSELVVETILPLGSDGPEGFLAEIIPEEGLELNVALETLRVD